MFAPVSTRPAAVTRPVVARAAVAVAKAAGTIVIGLSVAMSALLLALAGASRLSHHDGYVVFGHPVLRVLSGSMAPAVDAGDLVVDRAVAPRAARDLRVGQIITFRIAHSERYVTHRIVTVEHGASGGTRYLTKGDANDAPDAAAVPSTDVVGTVELRVPAGARVLGALGRPPVLAALAFVLLALLLAGPAVRWLRNEPAPSHRRRRALPTRERT
jgi:signal peptidase I